MAVPYPNAEDLLSAIKLSLDDLLTLSEYEPSVFADLYYNRDEDFSQFHSIMETASQRATNVLVLGEAGIGKTSFVHRLIRDHDKLSRNNLHPVIVDFATVVPRSPSGCLVTFSEQMERYFKAVSHPIHTLKAHDEACTPHNIREIKRHLEEIPRGIPHPVIFIDDLDYLDDAWHTLLEYFLPFAQSTKASLVLSARPPLAHSIEHYDDRFSHCFIRAVQRLTLRPLSASEILCSRLAPFLLEKKDHPLFARMLRLFLPTHPILKVMRRIGIQHIEDLPKLNYPFTEKHNSFMLRITNGNLRELFAIAYESIRYILATDLPEREEDGISRKIIGREGVLRCLYDSPDSSYHIANLNEESSRQGNSLRLNTLEAVKYLRVVDEKFFTSLKRLGHRRDHVLAALAWLTGKTQRMIHPTRLYPPGPPDHTRRVEYEITSKGDLYIQMATEWDDYMRRVPPHGRLLREMVE